MMSAFWETLGATDFQKKVLKASTSRFSLICYYNDSTAKGVDQCGRQEGGQRNEGLYYKRRDQALTSLPGTAAVDFMLRMIFSFSVGSNRTLSSLASCSGPQEKRTMMATFLTKLASMAERSICSLRRTMETMQMRRVKSWLSRTMRFICVRVVLMFSSSEKMSAVKVIVTTVVKDFSKSQKVSSIITAPWQILFHTQMRKVFRFNSLPFCRLWQSCGNSRTFSSVTSSSKMRQRTGSMVQTVVQPSMRQPLQMGMATEQKTREKMDWMMEMMSPRWITNWAITAVFLQASLPCHRISLLRYLNLRIEKSEANAACFPYFPTIPTPMSATWIMPTSLPPSPMPSTIFPVWFFTPWVITAF